MGLNPFYHVNKNVNLEIIRSKEWKPGNCPKENILYRISTQSYSAPILIFGELSLKDINLKGLCITDLSKEDLVILSVDEEKFKKSVEELYKDSSINKIKIPCFIVGNFDLDRIVNELCSCVKKE